MPVGSLVTRTPEEIEVIEIQPHVVPAGVAGVIIDDAVRRCEFVRRMGKAGNHHHRDTAPPCEPAQSARQTDEEVRILDQIDPFAWLELCAAMQTYFSLIRRGAERSKRGGSSAGSTPRIYPAVRCSPI